MVELSAFDRVIAVKVEVVLQNAPQIVQRLISFRGRQCKIRFL